VPTVQSRPPLADEGGARLQDRLEPGPPRAQRPARGEAWVRRYSHILRYAVVGLVATAFQLLVLAGLLSIGTAAQSANALSFLTSTQLNFVLSLVFTWSHRRCTRNPRAIATRCLSYNAVAGLALVVNAGAFWAAHHPTHLPALPSAVVAVGVSTIFTYVFSSRLIFATRQSQS
jgi:putative flippase GtrA